MTKKRKRETSRKTKGAKSISALIYGKIEEFLSDLDATSTKNNGVTNMKKFLRGVLNQAVFANDTQRYKSLCDRLEKMEQLNRTLQQTLDPMGGTNAIRLPGEIDLGQGPLTKHQKTFGGIRSITVAHPCETLIDYIKEHQPPNCLKIPMMQDCGLDESMLKIMTPEDAIAYHIMIRTGAFLLSIIDFKIINETEELAYSENFEMAVYIIISYLLRRKPVLVNPCEMGSDEDYVKSLAKITNKILVYTDFDRKKKRQVSEFVQKVCVARWETQNNMIKNLLTMFGNCGAMLQIVHAMVDAGDIAIREPTFLDPGRQSMCFVTQKFLPCDEITELTFEPPAHSDLIMKFPIRKELAAPFYGLFVWFNLPWIILQNNCVMTTKYSRWLSACTAVLRFTDKNLSQYLFNTLDQLTRV